MSTFAKRLGSVSDELKPIEMKHTEARLKALAEYYKSKAQLLEEAVPVLKNLESAGFRVTIEEIEIELPELGEQVRDAPKPASRPAIPSETAKPRVVNGAETVRAILKNHGGLLSNDQIATQMVERHAWTGAEVDARLKKAVRNILYQLNQQGLVQRVSHKNRNAPLWTLGNPNQMKIG